MSEPTKRCPYCREEILADAVKCKHCRSVLSGGTSASDAAAGEPDALDSAATIAPSGAGALPPSSRYTVGRKLGQGGMGIVYAAHDCELDTDVAVKVLPQALSSSEWAMKQIRREARLAMSLSHDNIVRVHNLEVEPSGALLVMELVEGRTLAEELATRGALPESEVVEMAKSMCGALSYAHERGVLHRDLKPANVMVSSDGVITLMDFGIARALSDTYTRVSGEVTTSGTLLYMSPEQLLGRDSDERSDIYSLSVMLYELLSGTPPFATGDITYQHLNVEPRPLDGVSSNVSEAILKGLSKDPADRWGDAGALAAGLGGTAEREELVVCGTIGLWSIWDGRPLGALEGHLQHVNSISFSPDGRVLASGSSDETIRLWDVSSGIYLRTLGAQSHGVSVVSFSPDGSTLASGGSEGGAIKLWDVSSGHLLRTIDIDERGGSETMDLSFSPNGRVIAIGSSDEAVRLWEVSSGRLLRTLEGHLHHVNSISFSPDGRVLASGSADGTIKLWETSSGRLLRMLEGHEDGIGTVSFSPDGGTLASGGLGDGTVKLWQVSSGQLLRKRELGTTVEDVSISPNGLILACANQSVFLDDDEEITRENTIVVCETAVDPFSNPFLTRLEGHSDLVTSVSFSPDGRTLASGSWDGTVRLWATWR